MQVVSAFIGPPWIGIAISRNLGKQPVLKFAIPDKKANGSFHEFRIVESFNPELVIYSAY